MTETRMELKKNKNRIIFLNIFTGFFTGILFAGILVFAYQWNSAPQDMRQLYRIKGYEKLNEDQTADIRMLSGTYETGYMDDWLSGAECKDIGADNPDIRSVENNKIEFADPRNAKFAGNDYQAAEICLNDRAKYEKLAAFPEMVQNIFGTKDAVEIRYERKGSGEDFFLVIISASGDMYFIPPKEMRTEENAGEYWAVYPLE